MAFEKIFPTDCLSKRERVALTLRHQAVDRAAILDQVSYNPAVVAAYAGKPIDAFDYGEDEICAVIRQTLDVCMVPVNVRRMGPVATADGFVIRYDHWHSWIESRPFKDEHGARDWLLRHTQQLRERPFNAEKCRADHLQYMTDLQHKIGETVFMPFSQTGFMDVYHQMGLEIFAYCAADYPDVLADYLCVSVGRELKRIHAVADRALSPVTLILEECAANQGPTFSPRDLEAHQYPHLKSLAEAWHEHGVAVLFASGGNYNAIIPELRACGLDGCYCLEPAAGMDIVELKNAYPDMVWACGVDGVALLEQGTPAKVKAEVRRQIQATNALQTGGLFVGSSSEINPPIRLDNFQAMIAAVGELPNPRFFLNGE
ncbi:MAG: hypothetical protein HYV35_10825 [Lentisphaerae bacterium]|nr:hypothetical protein [Lentisphaerota bacterium]